jgi:hypothetical protein
MAFSRIDLTIIAVVAVGMLWIEQEHRVFISPADAESERPASSVCPDTDDVPFSAECIKFIDGGVLPDIHARQSGSVSRHAAMSDSRARPDPHGPARPPSNENGPYSAACIQFMSGWYWQADSTGGAPK